MRTVAALLGPVVVIALLPLFAPRAGGQAGELEEARARATEAADAYTDAEVALDAVQVAIERNTEIMATYRPLMKPLYYDASKHPTYLDQLGVKFPELGPAKP